MSRRVRNHQVVVESEGAVALIPVELADANYHCLPPNYPNDATANTRMARRPTNVYELVCTDVRVFVEQGDEPDVSILLDGGKHARYGKALKQSRVYRASGCFGRLPPVRTGKEPRKLSVLRTSAGG
jgi:hypothetical protein